MESKIISCVLVASLLFSVGCYSTGIVTKEELKAKPKPVDIVVCTKDSLTYRFSKEQYHIQGDTLSGSGIQIRANTVVGDSVDVSLSLADIVSIEAREYRSGRTALLGLAIGLVVLIPLIVMLVRSFRVNETPSFKL